MLPMVLIITYYLVKTKHGSATIDIFICSISLLSLIPLLSVNKYFLQIVNDLKFTVTQAVEPVEKGIQKLHKISQNIKKHEKEKRTKDDSCIATSSPARRVIRGIDDPLLHGSISDSGTSRKKKHRRKSGYTSAESGGESSSDQSYGGIQVRGRRWLTKD